MQPGQQPVGQPLVQAFSLLVQNPLLEQTLLLYVMLGRKVTPPYGREYRHTPIHDADSGGGKTAQR